MAIVTVVYTFHSELGSCDEPALLQIVRNLDPDVIFLELRESDLISPRMQIVEVRVARKYATGRPVELVPVDEFDVPLTFLRDMDEVFDYVEHVSFEYVELKQCQYEATHRGFESINSDEFELLSGAIEKTLQRVIELSLHRDLQGTYDRWLELLARREEAMLKNIYRYCHVARRSRGVLLVGAGHATSMTKRIEKFISAEAGVARWELWNRPGRLNLKGT